MRRMVLSELAAPLAVCALALAVLASAAQAAPSDWNDLARSFGGPRDGDIIVEQPPNLTGGPGADTLFRNNYQQVVWQQVADDIVLSAPAAIRRVGWHGFYGAYQQSHQPPAGDEIMRIRFYSARAPDGLPGDILYEETLLNPSRTATGRSLDLFVPEFVYQADLAAPVALSAGTKYWLEIVQFEDLESHFRWECGDGGGTGYAFLNPRFTDWQYSVSDEQAFTLSTAPEPGVAALLGPASLLAFTIWGRKEGRRG